MSLLRFLLTSLSCFLVCSTRTWKFASSINCLSERFTFSPALPADRFCIWDKVSSNWFCNSCSWPRYFCSASAWSFWTTVNGLNGVSLFLKLINSSNPVRESRTFVIKLPLSDVVSITFVSKNFWTLAQKAFLMKSASLNKTTLLPRRSAKKWRIS